MLDGFVTTNFGRIHYHEAGIGPPVILLHSNGGSSYEFEFIIDKLAVQHHIIAWDMPGQGDSDPLLRHLSVEDYAAAVVAFMDVLGIERASVAGASIGGAISVALGAHHAKRIEQLFIVECPCRSSQEWRANWHNTEANYAPVVQTLEKVSPRFRSFDERLLTRWNIDRSKAGTKTTLSVMWALRLYDIVSDLPKVMPGSTVIFGNRGPTVGKLSEFKNRMQSPYVEIIENCGHFPMIDDPDEFVRIIESRFAPR